MHTKNQAKLIVKYETMHYHIIDVDVNIESNVCEIQKVVIFHLLQAMDEWWHWWGGGGGGHLLTLILDWMNIPNFHAY